MAKATLRCPECGATEGLYARIGARWNVDLGAFTFCDDVYSPLECTACDHEWQWQATGIDPLASVLSAR